MDRVYSKMYLKTLLNFLNLLTVILIFWKKKKTCHQYIHVFLYEQFGNHT